MCLFSFLFSLSVLRRECRQKACLYLFGVIHRLPFAEPRAVLSSVCATALPLMCVGGLSGRSFQAFLKQNSRLSAIPLAVAQHLPGMLRWSGSEAVEKLDRIVQRHYNDLPASRRRSA